MEYVIPGVVLLIIGIVGVIIVRQMAKRKSSDSTRSLIIFYTALALALGLTCTVYDTKFMLATPCFISSLHRMCDKIIKPEIWVTKE